MSNTQIITNLDNVIDGVVSTHVDILAVESAVTEFTDVTVPNASGSLTAQAGTLTAAYDANHVAKLGQVTAVADSVNTSTAEAQASADAALLSQQAAEGAELQAGLVEDVVEGLKADTLAARDLAEGYKTTAETAASTATQEAVDAESSAQSALGSAVDALSHKDDAEASSVDAENTSDEMGRKYLGSYTTPPTLDRKGGVLEDGATYWNSVTKLMYVWNGSEWGSYAEIAYIPEFTFTVDENGILLMDTTAVTEPGEYIEWSSI